VPDGLDDFAFAFGVTPEAAAATFDGCLAAGNLTMDDLGVSLLFLEVLRPLAGMAEVGWKGRREVYVIR
jgi:hypothetical protein